MSSIREVQANIPSACSYESAWMDSSTWTISSSSTSNNPCNILQPGTSIRIDPMIRQYGGWNDAHFHSSLRLPMGCSPGDGITVLLEAMASECVAVALSPDSQYVLGKTYVVHYGAFGNVSTVLRRRVSSGNEAPDIQITSRVCDEHSWIPYWLCLTGGKFYVGVGKIPGQRCIGMMDDTIYNQLRSGLDAVRFVGLGNSALGKSARPLKIRAVVVTTVPDALRSTLENLDVNSLSMVTIDSATTDEDTKKIIEAYEKECQKAKARAKKFAIPYKEPNPEAFLAWSKLKRLRSNPRSGFVTGIDIMSEEEQQRKRVRAERFGMNATKRSLDVELRNPPNDLDSQMDTFDQSPISMIEAWDNEEFVRPHRADPPKKLWTVPSEDDIETEEINFDFANDTARLMEEKIHVSSVDWAAFKQIRTDDIMSYFAHFGPVYVEWLGEVSCNVHFQEKYSAARALQGLSQPITSPPPVEIVARYDESQSPDFGRMGWRFCRQPLRKLNNDRYGRKGTTARILMRVATSLDALLEKPKLTPAPPPGFSTKRVLGPGSDFEMRHRRKRRKQELTTEERGEVNTYPEGDHPLLSKSLRSGRDGYSLEEMETERKQSKELMMYPEDIEG